MVIFLAGYQLYNAAITKLTRPGTSIFKSTESENSRPDLVICLRFLK